MFCSGTQRYALHLHQSEENVNIKYFSSWNRTYNLSRLQSCYRHLRLLASTNSFEVFISTASFFAIRREKGNLETILISTRSPKRGNSSADPPVLTLWVFYVRFYVFWPYLTVYNTIYCTAI